MPILALLWAVGMVLIVWEGKDSGLPPEAIYTAALNRVDTVRIDNVQFPFRTVEIMDHSINDRSVVFA